MGWKAIADSVEGTSHLNRKMPCQDNGNYKVVDGIIIGAVADGAGSAKHSDVGSRLAVETTLSYLARLARLLKWLKQKKKHNLRLPIPEDKAKKVFAKTLKKVISALDEEVKSKDYFINDLACTLLVFFATPDWIAAMQIGDGFIVVGLKESNDYQLTFALGRLLLNFLCPFKKDLELGKKMRRKNL